MPQDNQAPEVIDKAAALARGDFLPEQDLDPEHPDADGVAVELEKEIEKDAEKEAEKEADPKAEKDSKKDSRIPLSRHEAVLNKERDKRADLERQLAQYQNGKQVADVNTQITAAEDAIAKMDAQYDTLITDGELAKAADLKQQIRRAERDMNEAKSDMKIHAAEIRATERARYNTSLERIESAYPELNEDHEEFDQDLMAEVVELKDAYQMKGFTPTVALQKAVKALVEPRTTRQEMATSAKPQVSEKDVAAERKKDAVAKVEKATRTSPPNLNRSGVDSDKMGAGSTEAQAVMNMTQAEFKKFADSNPEALARARGDIL